MTITQLKQKYGETDKGKILPLYNLDPNEQLAISLKYTPKNEREVFSIHTDEKCLKESEVALPPVTDNKTRLQEVLQAKGLPAPEYQMIAEEGPPHMRVFTMAAFSQGVEIGRGMGNSKKKAEQAAAGMALEEVKA